MTEEKKKILELIETGKLTATEGLELLKALEGDEQGVTLQKRNGVSGRFLRVKVKSEKNNVNIKLPLRLFKMVSKIANAGIRLIPAKALQEMREEGVDLTQIDFEELVNLIDEGLEDGKLVDIDAEDSTDGQTKIKIYVE